MDSSLLVTLEILLVLAVVLGLGGWDLWKLRREQARDRAQAAADEKTPDRSPVFPHPIGGPGEARAGGPFKRDDAASGRAATPGPREP